jgi:hypothetical protein
MKINVFIVREDADHILQYKCVHIDMKEEYKHNIDQCSIWTDL